MKCDGGYKIIESRLSSNNGDNLSKFRQGVKSFVAPEVAQSGANFDDYRNDKSNVYSLGLCLLEACTLVSEPQYLDTYGNVNHQLIQIKILNSQKPRRYSNATLDLIIKMLAADPALRPSR